MADEVWTFGPVVEERPNTYEDGTVVPGRTFGYSLNGVPVGTINVHLHRRRGPDGKVDVSVGTTIVMFGPPPGGR